MDCLETSSILHVLLLVYLRFCIIKNPMTKVVPIRYRKVLLILTWMIPIVTMLPMLFVFDSLNLHELLVYDTIRFLIFSTSSVPLIIGLYGKMIFTIKRKKQEHLDTHNLCWTTSQKRFDDKITRLISILVLVVCICYVPFVIQRTAFYVSQLTNLNELAIPGTSCWKVIESSDTVAIN